MLERTRNIHPKKVSSQNQLIDAMEANETVIYVTGSYAEEIKKTAIKNKAERGIWKAGKVIGLVGILANPLVGLACFGLSSVNGALTENFKNYKIDIDNEKNRIKLTKTKGKNAYRPKLDTIIE